MLKGRFMFFFSSAFHFRLPSNSVRRLSFPVSMAKRFRFRRSRTGAYVSRRNKAPKIWTKTSKMEIAQKHQVHEAYWVRAPPHTGPITGPISGAME